MTNRPFAACHVRWGQQPYGGNFTTLDGALVSNLCYIPDRKDLLGNLTTAFSNHPLGVPRLRELQPWKTVGRWLVLEFDSQVDVLGFRGSATTLDFVIDMEM